jgi:hypothetical protein
MDGFYHGMGGGHGNNFDHDFSVLLLFDMIKLYHD